MARDVIELGELRRPGPAALAESDTALSALADRAARPLAEALALPGLVYRSPWLYDLELARIFKDDWIYVGTSQEIPAPGDFFTVEIAGEPLVIVRDRGHQVRALSRVCQHRFADLFPDQRSGTVSRLVCPYHSWAYQLDGSLSAAPLMDGSTLFRECKSSIRLHNYRIEEWHGFIFVSLTDDATPLAAKLGEADPLVAPYRLAEWRTITSLRWEMVKANWKLVMENARECYHHQGTHKATLEPVWPTRHVKTATTDSSRWFYQNMMISRKSAVGENGGHLEHPTLLPVSVPLSPFSRSQTLLVGVYPNFFITASPDVCAVFRVLPLGPEAHELTIHLLAHEAAIAETSEPEMEDVIEILRASTMTVQTEDIEQIEAVQRSLDSRYSTGGPLSALERPVWQFQRYLAAKLLDAG